MTRTRRPRLSTSSFRTRGDPRSWVSNICSAPSFPITSSGPYPSSLCSFSSCALIAPTYPIRCGAIGTVRVDADQRRTALTLGNSSGRSFRNTIVSSGHVVGDRHGLIRRVPHAVDPVVHVVRRDTEHHREARDHRLALGVGDAPPDLHAVHELVLDDDPTRAIEHAPAHAGSVITRIRLAFVSAAKLSDVATCRNQSRAKSAANSAITTTPMTPRRTRLLPSVTRGSPSTCCGAQIAWARARAGRSGTPG